MQNRGSMNFKKNEASSRETDKKVANIQDMVQMDYISSVDKKKNKDNQKSQKNRNMVNMLQFKYKTN